MRDADGAEVLEAHEASWLVALLPRFADLASDALSVLTWLPFNFVLLRGGRHEVRRGGRGPRAAREGLRQVASAQPLYRRVLGKLRDRYVLELEPGLSDVDRRLVLAFAVGLDALQDR